MASLLCGTTLVSAAQADDVAPTLVLSEPWFQLGATEHTWKYDIHLTGVPTGKDTTFVLSLRLPERAEAKGVGESAVNFATSRRSPFTDIRITTKESTTVTLQVTGHPRDVKIGPRVAHQWRLSANGDAHQVSASAPEENYDPSLMRFVFGSGLSLRQDDHIDFVVDENTLRIDNDSRLRVATTVGALFKISEFGDGLPVDILVSLDFTQEPRRALDGFMFGAAFGVNKYMSIGGGYELRVGRKLSPGFRRTSAKLIEELLNEDKYKGDYATFSQLVDPGLEDVSHYDWFPLADPREQPRVMFGEPMITSYNHGWFLGLFVPVDFKRLFSMRN